MQNRESSLENRLEEMSVQLQVLARKVEMLEARLERSTIALQPMAEEVSATSQGETSERVLDWVGKSSLLQRLAITCFLLVVALILRTVTDNNILDKEVGSLLGMVYASGLMAWGWHIYPRNNPLAPVFSVCGALLLFSIVVETHEHFESLPTIPAYLLITLAGAAMALTSHRNKVALPVFVGTLGMCFAGTALDFPNPAFPYLVALLLAANILGTFATRLQRCSWLRWILLFATIFMMQVWAFRLGIFATRGTPEQLALSSGGFFPSIVVIGLAYWAMAVAGILGRITDRISRFDLALPSINIIWTYTVCRYVVGAGVGNELILGAFGAAAAMAHFGLAFWLRKRTQEAGANSFAIAGTLLLAMSLPAATGSKLVSLAILSAVALGIGVLSRQWRSGGMRLLSYILQFYSCAALALQLRTTDVTQPSVLGAAASGALALIAFKHYLWARYNPPPAESTIFKRFGRKDGGVSVLLAAALLGGFFTARVGVYQVLERMAPVEALADAFTSAQSVLINASAALLMCFAFSRRDKVVRNVAILVTVIGGAKVFLLDLFGLKGVPVVASMLSFGVAAFLESFALSRWQKIDTLRVSQWPRQSGTNEKKTEKS